MRFIATPATSNRRPGRSERVSSGKPYSSVAAEAAKQTLQQFLAAYPHSWLLVEARKAGPPKNMLFETIAPSAAMTADALNPALLRISDADVRSQPQNYELHALTKSPRNPWTDRILIGRAANNDVVLLNPSVSKVHAYLVLAGGTAQIFSYETRNPTKVGVTTALPNGPGINVADGADLQIGVLRTRYLSGTLLYKLMRP